MKTRKINLKSFFLIRKVFLLAISLTAASFYPAEAAKAPLMPLKCEAPVWLQKSVHGSMEAVWRELLGSGLSLKARTEALALVGSRLFPGFSVKLNEKEQVIMTPEQRWKWEVAFSSPEMAERLPDEPARWIHDDIQKIVPEIQSLVDSVPPEALRWSSETFQEKLNNVIADVFPGWRPSVRITAEGFHARMEVKIYPQPPVLLAVSPVVHSSSVPQLLADRMGEKTMEHLSPLTGLPLAWLKCHRNDIIVWLDDRLRDDKWLTILKAVVENDITLKPLSKVSTKLESHTYSLRGWFSVHAGSNARLEAGVHLGRYFSVGKKLPSEVYAELLLGMEHWHTDFRYGVRFSPWQHVWLGLEGSTERESHFWYRMWYEASPKKFYGWMRYSDTRDFEAAIGYHLNRYISLEMYYDDRQDHRLSLRALGSL